MKKKFKNITVPYFYFDDKNNNSYFIFQDKEYIKLNELLKAEDPIYNYHYRLRDILHLKHILFEKKIYKEYKDIILPKKIYSKEFNNYYYVTGGRYYGDILYALEDVYNNSFYYQFGGPNRENVYNHSHAHQFSEVINEVFWNFENF